MPSTPKHLETNEFVAVPIQFFLVPIVIPPFKFFDLFVFGVTINIFPFAHYKNRFPRCAEHCFLYNFSVNLELDVKGSFRGLILQEFFPIDFHSLWLIITNECEIEFNSSYYEIDD